MTSTSGRCNSRGGSRDAPVQPLREDPLQAIWLLASEPTQHNFDPKTRSYDGKSARAR
jgi:hypothetical protein